MYDVLFESKVRNLRAVDEAQRPGQTKRRWVDVVFVREQAANVMFEGIEAQRPLKFRKVGETQRIGLFISSEQFPDDLRVKIHQ